jgi:hypothetical protein
MSGYLDYSGREDRLSGGARRIPVTTPAGQYRVWVKRVGNNPGLRELLLHGGPGETHGYLEVCDSYLPAAGIEYYYYYYYYDDDDDDDDQLGSGFSDQPDQPSLWELGRFVDEVEQGRTRPGCLTPARQSSGPGCWATRPSRHWKPSPSTRIKSPASMRSWPAAAPSTVTITGAPQNRRARPHAEPARSCANSPADLCARLPARECSNAVGRLAGVRPGRRRAP